jgi:N-dimethylarginine dimethylaminohydrolase
VPADWPKADNLIAEMEQHANYVLVYHTENVYIFAAPAANTTKENKEFTQIIYIKNAKVIHREWIL